jgi:alkylation response protein AidB-like acyl-CoA dehydrogenase
MLERAVSRRTQGRQLGDHQWYHDIVQRAVQLHGALGTTRETPLGKMWMGVPMLAVADGPTEVQKVQLGAVAE